MKLRLLNPDISSDDLEASVLAILDSVELCSMSTVTSSGESYVHTAYFCYDDQWNIYFVSDPSAEHCQNLTRSATMAVAVYGTDQPWDEPHRGLQLFGQARMASTLESLKAVGIHARRFHAYSEYLRSLSPFEKKSIPHRFYIFSPDSIKVFDESAFGEETFVIAQVDRT